MTTTGNTDITTGVIAIVDKEDFALHEIKDVEIFSTGKWNGTEITDKDLDNIIHAFNNTKLKPFLKLGHNEEQKLLKEDGLPAAGWVGSLKKIGNKLVADFVDIPQKIYELIKNKAYKKVSCEIFHNIQIDNQKYPRLLGAVALLGSNVPAVMNLSDILAMYSNNLGLCNDLKQANLKIYDHKQENEVKDKIMEDKLKKFELELKEGKDKLDKISKDIEVKNQKIDSLEKYKLEAEAKLQEAIQKEEQAGIDLYVNELVHGKLCSNAMKPLVKTLFENKDSYKIDEKELNKKDIIKEILSLSKELVKVNFEEKTEEGDKKDKENVVNDKIEKYQKENKCKYADAYKAVMKEEK